MFYSVFVLGKKGPLARVWLAAHWDKKITKAQILETNIVESVDSILQPKVKLSLRTSSHLLLGIVRIYARKTLYLLQDCQDAAFKIKSAFRPGVVDLPDGKTEAAISAITLPEMFDFINDFDLMPEPQLHLEPATTANIRSITIPDDISNIHMDDPLQFNDLRPDWSEIGSIGGGSITIKDGTDPTILSDSGVSMKNNFEMYDRPALDDGFGGALNVGIVDEDDVFGLPPPAMEEMNSNANENQIENGHDNTEDNGGGLSPRPGSSMSGVSDFGAPDAPFDSPPSSPASPGSPNILDDDGDLFNSVMNRNGNNMDTASMMTDDSHIIRPTDSVPGENVLTQNTMVLEPLDSQMGLERKRKRRKKIGMVIDEVKTLSGEEMKAQLSDTSDIISNLDLAPPNKMLMNWKKTGLSDKLFSLPERAISTKVLYQYYSRNLITSRFDDIAENEANDDFLVNPEGPEDEQEIAYLNGHRRYENNQDYEEMEQQDKYESGPKTPRAPKSPAPRRKRKTDDKENKEVTKRPRNESKYEKANHVNDRSELLQNSELNNISSIQDARDQSEMSTLHDPIGDLAGDQLRRSSVTGAPSVPIDPYADQYNNLEKEDEEEPEEDHDDLFDFGGNGPMSVGPMEEMLPDETADQYEERIRTKRSNILLKNMSSQLEEVGEIQFSQMIRNNKKKMVAQKFYALLVLKKSQAIELRQEEDMPYSDLFVTKGLKFDEHMVSTA